MKTNKCLSDTEIQIFIDGEFSTERHKELQRHLADCEQCSARLAEQKGWIEFVISSLKKEIAEKDIAIPPFNTGLPQARNKNIKINFRSFLKITAVIAVLVGGYLILDKKEPNPYAPTAQDLLLWEETMRGDDANQVWHHRTISAMETNVEGEVITIKID